MFKVLSIILVSTNILFAGPLWSKFKSFFDTTTVNNSYGGYPVAPDAFRDFANSKDIVLSRDIGSIFTLHPVSYNHSYRIPVMLNVANMTDIKGCVVVMVVKYASDTLGDALADMIAAISAAYTNEEYDADKQSGTLVIRDRVFLYYVKALEGWVYIGAESVFGAHRFMSFFDPNKNPFGEKNTGEPTIELQK